MRRLLLFLSVCLFPGLLNAQFMYKGLGGVVTNQLTIDSDTVFASTSNGLYRKYLYSNDTVWQQVSFSGRTVLNTLFLDHSECLMLVAFDPVFHKAQLYRSSDRGTTSTLFLSDTVYYGYPFLMQLAKSPYGKDTIYSLLNGKKTYDGGQSWVPLAPAGQYAGGNFIYINPGNSRELFTGGENMIFAASLQHSSDNGQNWQQEDCSNVFAGDNALEVFHVADDYWYASGEGIVVRRHKDTANWTQLMNVYHHPRWAMYMFGFGISPVNSNYMYVSGANDEATVSDSVRVLKSTDKGLTWDSVTFAMPQMSEYAVHDLKVHHVWGEDRIWMGGYGVFTYTQAVPLQVDDDRTEHRVVLYPNPTSEQFTIMTGGKMKAEKVLVRITNALGQTIFRQQFSGFGELTVSVKAWAAGTYQIRVSTYENTEVLRLIKR